MKICIVSSCGGHLTEVLALSKVYENWPHFYVINDTILLPQNMEGKTKFITHSERDFKFIINLYQAFCILRTERPNIILSTGAGPVVAFALTGRLFFNCHIIFIETITRIHKPSLTARIMYYLANDFFYQWKSLSLYFPKGQYGGLLL